MLRTRIIITMGVLTLALTATTAGAQEVYAPDARDRNATALDSRPPVSPDAVDNRRAAEASRATDLPTKASGQIQPVERVAEGFGWGDAGIGAAGTLGIVLALAGSAVLTTHQRARGQGSILRH